MNYLKWKMVVLGFFTAVLAANGAVTNTYYVNANNGSPLAPYTNWTDAATGIQAAVNQAQSDVNPGTTECIVLVTNGAYNLTSQIVIGKPITVQSVSGPGVTTVNGGYPTYTNRCFLITNNATLNGFTITNGCVFPTDTTPANTNFGGGIYAINCDALITNCTIMKNRALASSQYSYGGGIALGNGRTEVKNCVIATNMAFKTTLSYGGGLYMHDWTGSVVNCSVVSNTAVGGDGGGFYASSTAGGAISNCYVQANSGRYGAGGGVVGGATVVDCTFTNNSSASGRGTVHVTAANAVVRNCMIVNNYAGLGLGAGVYASAGLVDSCFVLLNRSAANYNGGGVYITAATVQNCLIAGNQVYGTGVGGGVYKDSTAGYLFNCTIAQNRSDSNGVAGLYTIVANRPNTFRNLIVYDNQSTNGDATCIASSVVAWRDNFAYCTAPELTDGVNSNSTADPLFATAGIGYGTNATLGVYTLQAGSPCIETGTNHAWMSTATDLAKNARLSPSYGTVDRGCYEVAISSPSVDSLPTAAGITYGQLLGASSLSGGSATNASGAPVPGSFAFMTPNLAPNAGATNVLVTFTPSDTASYNVITSMVSVAVSPRAVSLLGSRAYDGTTGASYTILNVVNKVGGDTVTVASGSGTLSTASDGSWATIVSFGSLALGNNALGNYTLTGASGSVAIGAVSAITNTYYVVSSNPAAESPYDTWAKAAPDIQTAVNQANLAVNHGVVECLVLVTNGTYSLTSQIVIGKPIMVHSVAGPDSTTVNGGYPSYTNRCFLITNNATLSGFTITNGYADATGTTPATTNIGGGVYAVNCDALITNCVIKYNNVMSYTGRPAYGGGIALGDGGTELKNCTIETNVVIYVVASYGGGLYLHNWTGLVANCIIASNAAYNGYAGGVEVATTAAGVISNCTIRENMSRYGAAAVLDGGATLVDSIISSNTTASSKGGVWVAAVNAIVRNCLITGNYAGQAGGAGVYAAAGLVENCRILFNRGGPGYSGGGVYVGIGTVRNCLIAGNQVTGTGLGGGVYKDTGAGYLINCTVAQNQSDSNGVAGIFSGVTTRPETFRNLVVYDNQSTNGDATCIASSYASWQDNFAYCTAPELTDGVNSNSTANPTFTTSGSGYGTNASLGVYTLQAGSPCIDTGTNQVWMDAASDLAGGFRRSPSYGAVDRGCYEVQVNEPLVCSFTASGALAGEPPLQAVFTAAVTSKTGGVVYQWIFGNGTTNDWTPGRTVVTNTYGIGAGSYTVILNVTNAVGERASATNINSVSVYPATPSVASLPTATGIVCGQQLGDSSLSGGSATNALGGVITGTFSFTAPGTIMSSTGTYSAPVMFTATDAANYNAVTVNVNVAVAKGIPQVSSSPAATGITYGQSLRASSLTGGGATNASGASIPGSFTFTTTAVAPHAGTTNVPVTFTPNDTASYLTITSTASVVVAPRPVMLLGSRLYDGTTVASYTILSVVNKVGGDTVAVVSGSSTLSTASDGSWATIVSPGTLVLGNDALGDYTLAGASGMVAIGEVSALTNTYYVVPHNPDAESPYNTWGKAAPDIQTAVNQAGTVVNPGTVECVVLVTNGTYDLISQIVIGKPITVRSVAGRDVTTVNGGYPTYTNRCFFITNNATLDGFTITNGCAGVIDETPASTNIGGGIYAVNCDALITNCTILRNLALSMSGKPANGGGVALGNGATELNNCTVATNVASYVSGVAQNGGGVYVHNWTGLVANCTIVSNSANNGYGGGIEVAASAAGTISNCVLQNNISKYAAGASLDGGATLVDCTFTNNTSSSGRAAVFLNTDTAILRDSLVIRNTSPAGSGGGVFAVRGLVENCSILLNSCGSGAYSGGGVFMQYSTVRNCLIAGNQVAGTGTGGGVYMDNKLTGYLINCTIAQNQSDSDGTAGLYTVVTNRSSAFLNLIVFSNKCANGDTTNIASSVSNWRDNFAFCTAPELTDGVNSNSTADPSFTAVGSGYGTNATLGVYTLQVNSPCIDTGANQVWMDTARDLAGQVRRSPSYGSVDRGCYEVLAAQMLDCSFSATSASTGAAPITVEFTAMVGGDTNGAVYQWIFGDGITNDWSSGQTTIAHTYAANGTPYSVLLNVTNAAGEQASATNLHCVRVYPVTVYVSTNGLHVEPFDTWAGAATNIQSALDMAGDGFTTEAIVSNGLYEVTENVVLDKGILLRSVRTNNADVIVKGGFPASTNRCFMITAAGAVLDGFTISNGVTFAVNNAVNYGAGINMTAGTVKNCLIVSNSSPGSYAGGVYLGGGRVMNSFIGNNLSQQDGGGCYLANASVVVSNCIIAGNRGGSGGGARLSSGLIVDCVISNNSAVNYGGAIYSQGYGIVSNCVVVGNSGSGGGGIRKSNPSGGDAFINCRIEHNHATTGNGGGVWVDPVNGNNGGTFRNCLIAGNTARGFGGGVFAGHNASFENCTVVGNSAATNGGMMFAAGVTMATGLNCIVYHNESVSNAPVSQADLLITATNGLGTIVTNVFFSCSPYLVAGQQGNIASSPQFANDGENFGLNLTLGDYRLMQYSPCIDTATNLNWMSTTLDLARTNRIQGAGPNMGAYETVVPVVGSVFKIR